jgi:hypothetical protein
MFAASTIGWMLYHACCAAFLPLFTTWLVVTAVQHVPACSIAGMTALQRLSLLTKEVPAKLSELTALRTLSIGDLAPWNLYTAKSLEVGVKGKLLVQS